MLSLRMCLRTHNWFGRLLLEMRRECLNFIACSVGRQSRKAEGVPKPDVHAKEMMVEERLWRRILEVLDENTTLTAVLHCSASKVEEASLQ